MILSFLHFILLRDIKLNTVLLYYLYLINKGNNYYFINDQNNIINFLSFNINFLHFKV